MVSLMLPIALTAIVIPQSTLVALSPLVVDFDCVYSKNRDRLGNYPYDKFPSLSLL